MEETNKELNELKQQLQKKQELCKQEREVQQQQVQKGAQHVQIDEAMPIQVVDSSEQLSLGRQGEPLQGKQELEQDINLMPHHQEVELPTSPRPDDEKVSSDQGGIEILGDQAEGEMHNISFNESQHKVVQSRRVSTLDDHTSPVQF